MEIFILKLLSLLVCIITIITGWVTFFLNPGIVYNNKDINSENKIYCFQCRFQYPRVRRTMKHCEKCGVCYFGRDHHCDVFGKCVAKNNMKLFITFNISICCLFIINFVYIPLMVI